MHPIPALISILILALRSTSQEAPGAATTTPSTETDAVATQTVIEVPISQYTFSAFPVPSQVSGAGVSPLTDPRDPPPVGSSLIPDFAHAWASAYQEAKNRIANLTIDEKVSFGTGVGWMSGRCVGNTPPIGVNGSVFPGLCLEDSPLGVRFADFVTAFPTGINTAATWNRKLIRRRGLYMGRENVGKGVNVALGPMMNIGRVAQGGRNWEGFGADPFLAGEAAYETILGMQEAGVQACAKHLINNEQEHFRTQESSDVDDRTQHEIYAHPFMRSIMAGVASIMCSYNLINGTYACENDKIMNDIIKREFGFQGYIMSDWSATHSTISAATGLDVSILSIYLGPGVSDGFTQMTMPGDITFQSGTTYFGANLTAYVENGTIPEARVDDMATRILAAWYLLHQDAASYPTTNFDAFNPANEATNAHVDVQADHDALVREIGAASTVLLKNTNGALPLKKPRSILLAGSDAGPGRIGPNQFADQGGVDGILAMGWGSGTANLTYLISPLEAIQRRARKDRTSVSWILDDWDTDRAGNMAIGRSAALVFLQSDSGEEYITFDGNEGDRQNLTAWNNGDNLVLAVAAQNNNTIVVVHSVGPLILEPWIEHPNVTAVLWAGVSGAEAGECHYGCVRIIRRSSFLVGEGGDILNITYAEGLHVDYRAFDAFNITPRFEFGFGLSYTNFTYSNLHIAEVGHQASTDKALEDSWAAGNATPIAQGSSTALWLHRPLYNVTFEVENTGPVWGGDIPQLYVHMPASASEPPSLLKGLHQRRGALRREEDCLDLAFTARPEFLGRGRAGMEDTERDDWGLRRDELEGCAVEWGYHDGLGSMNDIDDTPTVVTRLLGRYGLCGL
ncbi:Glycoside hydrolase family 3 protein [Mycena sanguinolenta]|uniref:beta-glucosidase n=1 Tax=Mycena sanguinolenta TaxID=230812 RepID=A0A8H7D6M6_9AGAR|nr:Glycoside hydrolase family 3 protein [Mycena sanguinolenta]